MNPLNLSLKTNMKRLKIICELQVINRSFIQKLKLSKNTFIIMEKVSVLSK